MAEKKSASSSSMKVSVKAKEAGPPKPAQRKVEVTSRSMSISIGGGKRPAPARKKKKKPLMMSEARVLIPYVLSMFFLFATILSIKPHPAPSPLDGGGVPITIEAGMSATQVSVLLEERGVVDSASALLAYIVDEGLATTLQSGSFVFGSMMGYAEAAAILSPKAAGSSVTIGGGFTIKRIDALLTQRSVSGEGEFIQAVDDLVRAHHLGFGEGWLLSGTYAVSTTRGAETLARAMYEAMLGKVQKNLNSPLLERYSIEELLIVASLIQAETQNPGEMAGISAVIHNRLAIDEPLGIDASTRYELDDWHSPIPAIALETLSPYNTRRKRGLPPTGIAAPSKEAVRAAFFPEARSDLFYLHGLDQQIHFAHTYDEHLSNIRRYR